MKCYIFEKISSIRTIRENQTMVPNMTWAVAFANPKVQDWLELVSKAFIYLFKTYSCINGVLF